jgi:hypothetical protein
MKKHLLLLLISTNVMATERVLISDSKITDVELSNTSVRCSAIGYRMPELKINIKGLDGWTIFDHSNIKAGDFQGQPCMTAGFCKYSEEDKTGFSIDDILSGGIRTERLKIHRKIVEVKNVDKDQKGNDICKRHIEERLQTTVNRGDGSGKITFNHFRWGINETFPLSACQ